MSHNTVLDWRWGANSCAEVFVAGDFSNWNRWPMRFTSGLDSHRVSVPKRLVSNGGIIEFKFIVDGLWTCDGSLPMKEDEFGNVNNVLATERIDALPLQRRDSSGRMPVKKHVSRPSRMGKLPPPSVAMIF
jgi:hypothetical protein